MKQCRSNRFAIIAGFLLMALPMPKRYCCTEKVRNLAALWFQQPGFASQDFYCSASCCTPPDANEPWSLGTSETIGISELSYSIISSNHRGCWRKWYLCGWQTLRDMVLVEDLWWDNARSMYRLIAERQRASFSSTRYSVQWAYLENIKRLNSASF